MKIAIVTGASSGMGREFVRQLHSYIQPDAIWAIARRQSALEALAAETAAPQTGDENLDEPAEETAEQSGTYQIIWLISL